MTVFAPRLPFGTHIRRTLDIYAMRDRFEMRRIHTSPILAKMIDFKAFGNRPINLLIGEAMGINPSLWQECENSIPAFNYASCPQKAVAATIQYDLAPKTFLGLAH